jgi:hypothetical protein
MLKWPDTRACVIITARQPKGRDALSCPPPTTCVAATHDRCHDRCHDRDHFMARFLTVQGQPPLRPHPPPPARSKPLAQKKLTLPGCDRGPNLKTNKANPHLRGSKARPSKGAATDQWH